MVDDSELDYIADFLRKVHTAHTVHTIETTRNIALIPDSQSILVYTGEVLGSSGIIVQKRYPLKYKDATEGALNSSIYALVEGIRKLNSREAITSYTRNTSLVGMKFISSGLDFYNINSGKWYANIKILAEWLTT